MLVLSRQRDESIIIGDNVIVTIVDVRGDRVRLGIEAPREVSVHRREVYDAIQRENQQAAQIQPDQARRIADGSARRPLVSCELLSAHGHSLCVVTIRIRQFAPQRISVHANADLGKL